MKTSPRVILKVRAKVTSQVASRSNTPGKPAIAW